MPTTIEFCHAIPVMPALDLPKAIAFYEQQLGFTKKFVYDDYVGISRGSVEVHLWLCNDPQIPKNTSCRINVKNIDELYEEYWRANVIHPNGKLVVKPWGLKEFVILDLNGNAIHFAETVL